ncbi:2-polyprenyl-6-methoxyphenol hydroxylase-like FAD-dependent oxidoreductase [Streptomyces tendae]|uniref:FAD-dependent monooxygenase n=1 Tax=Streptomyces tendae TaxID=1932 RepID=UPI003837E5F8
MGTEKHRTTAIVVGAGIGGLTAAAVLSRAGLDVRVYERATELRAAGSGLSVMTNALTALSRSGMDLGLEKHGQAVEVFKVLDRRGRLIREQPLKEVSDRLGAPCVSISRAALQSALLTQAGDVPITFRAAATRYETDDEGVTVHFADGTTARGDILVGADGFRSAVRRQLAGPEEERDSGYLSWLALAPFEDRRLRPGYVGHYWGRGRRFGLIDIGHGRYYWWGTYNMPAARSRSWSGGKDEILRVFDGWAPEVLRVVQQTPEDAILSLPSCDRVFLERWGDGPVTLLGDAAHPMLTSLGQGAAMAIEDAVVLADAMARHTDDPRAGLRAYEDARRERTRAMVANARRTSDLEQLEHPVATALRNAFLRWVPKSVLARPLEAALTFTPPGAGFGYPGNRPGPAAPSSRDDRM